MKLTRRILELIELERHNQDVKWGSQLHGDQKWLVILLEELGEVARAILEADGMATAIELVQAAAVIVAWLEYYLNSRENVELIKKRIEQK